MKLGVAVLLVILNTCPTVAILCTTSSCMNGGLCIENGTGMSCGCDSTGFQGDSCQTDVDECQAVLGSPCGSSHCSNTEGSFVCYCYNVINAWFVCHPDETSGTGPKGMNAANGDTNSSEIMRPIFDALYPTYGPESGGTLITLLGKHLQNLVPLFQVTIGGVKGNITSRESHQLLVVVPKAPGINVSLAIKISYLSVDDVDTGLTYTYKPDPIIRKIYPLQTIMSGGTWLTVEGMYLNSVAEPELLIALMNVAHNTTRRKRGLLHILKRSTRNEEKAVLLKEHCNKETVTFSSMECKVPNMTGVLTEDDYQSYRLYVGVLLDGVETYRNVSQKLPEYGIVNINNNPTFENKPDGFLIDPDNYLKIEGKSLTDGSGIKDYSIAIGQGMCDVVDLVSSELTCRPPAERPGQTKEDKQHGTNKYRVKVSVGYRKIHVIGVGSYPVDYSLYYIVGGLAAASLLVIVVSVIACCVIRREAYQENKASPASDSRDIELVNTRRVGSPGRAMAFPGTLGNRLSGTSRRSTSHPRGMQIVPRLSSRRRHTSAARRPRDGYLPPT